MKNPNSKIELSPRERARIAKLLADLTDRTRFMIFARTKLSVAMSYDLAKGVWHWNYRELGTVFKRRRHAAAIARLIRRSVVREIRVDSRDRVIKKSLPVAPRKYAR